jgi:hypothetical protein
MRINDLIHDLQKIRDEHGNIQVGVLDDEGDKVNGAISVDLESFEDGYEIENMEAAQINDDNKFVSIGFIA